MSIAKLSGAVIPTIALMAVSLSGTVRIVVIGVWIALYLFFVIAIALRGSGTSADGGS